DPPPASRDPDQPRYKQEMIDPKPDMLEAQPHIIEEPRRRSRLRQRDGSHARQAEMRLLLPFGPADPGDGRQRGIGTGIVDADLRPAERLQAVPAPLLPVAEHVRPLPDAPLQSAT